MLTIFVGLLLGIFVASTAIAETNGGGGGTTGQTACEKAAAKCRGKCVSTAGLACMILLSCKWHVQCLSKCSKTLRACREKADGGDIVAPT